MDLFDVLTMVRGLALFLYGMSLLGDGLSKASGGRMEKNPEKLTSNPIKAVLFGAGVTAVIQSSSATTVMVVGFVNSGIMKLSTGSGNYHGSEYWYDGYVMDLKPDRNWKAVIFYSAVKTHFVFTDHGGHRCGYFHVLEE